MRFSSINTGYLVALLSIGSAMMPLSAVAHTEGVEAADPATPSALLGLRSAADRFDVGSSAAKAWREIFTGERASAPMMDHAGMSDHAEMGDQSGMGDHAGHMMHSDSATMQQ